MYMKEIHENPERIQRGSERGNIKRSTFKELEQLHQTEPKHVNLIPARPAEIYLIYC